MLPAETSAPEWNGKVIRFGDTSEVRELKRIARGDSWLVSAEVCGKPIEFSLTPGAPHRGAAGS